jgi:exonuclease III
VHCILPIFSNSFFNIEDAEDKSNAPTGTSGVNVNKHTFKDLRDIRRFYPKNVMAAHLNINSFRYKFDEIKEVLTDNIVDLLIISEPKLDKSFNDNLFSVDGYKVQRRDKNQYGGGLLTFIRSDFPAWRKHSLESEQIETLCHEVYISNRKWLIAGAYKPPSMSNNQFTGHFSRFADRSLTHNEHMLLFGDLNFDMLN